MLVLSVLLYKITKDTVFSGSIKDKYTLLNQRFHSHCLLNFTENDFLHSILYKTDNLLRNKLDSFLLNSFLLISTPNATKGYYLALLSTSWSNSSKYTFTRTFLSLPTSLEHFSVTPNFTWTFLCHSQLHSNISPSLPSNLSPSLSGSVFAISNFLFAFLSTTFLLMILKIKTFLLLTFSASHVLHFLLAMLLVNFEPLSTGKIALY